MTRHVLSVATPLDWVTLEESNGAIVRLSWGREDGRGTPLLQEASRQLDAYFSKHLTNFDLPLAPAGSDIQKHACALMSDIPHGETRTYGALAKDLGISAQAMGQLCGGNPIPIVIPCHRVLGANGLGGFSGDGGVETKVWLLRHEGAAGLLI